LSHDTIDSHATKVIARLHEFDAARAAGGAKPENQKDGALTGRAVKA
jgi:hypothetical protein